MCFQFTHFPCNWGNIYILYLIIIIKSEVWTITHCLGLGHETMYVFLYSYGHFPVLVKISCRNDLCIFCLNKNQLNNKPIALTRDNVRLTDDFVAWRRHMAREIWVNIFSNNGLLPDGTWTNVGLSSPCVRLRLSQFPQRIPMQYMALCIFSLSISGMMIMRICILYLIIIIKSFAIF